jgi:hypothetical protein
VQETQAYVEPTLRSAAERVEAAVSPVVQKVQSGIEYGVEQIKQAPEWLQGAPERGAQINEEEDLAAIKAGLKERAQGAWNTAEEYATKGAEAAKEAVEAWSEQERRADEQEREAIQQGLTDARERVKEEFTKKRGGPFMTEEELWESYKEHRRQTERRQSNKKEIEGWIY